MKIIPNYPQKTISFSGNWTRKDEMPNSTIYFYENEMELLFDSYKIKKPKGIIEDLKQAQADLQDCVTESRLQDAIDYIETTGKYKDEKLYGISGLGRFSIAYDIGNDRILKISKFNPLEYRPYNKDFDIPFLSPVEKFKDNYCCLQAKAELENSTILDVLRVKRKMHKAGYTSSFDFDLSRKDQVGKYKGISYLLDTRCAVPKHNVFTSIVLFFRNYLDLDLQRHLNKMDFYDYFAQEERPVKNFSKKEGFKIIKKAIKSWF